MENHAENWKDGASGGQVDERQVKNEFGYLVGGPWGRRVLRPLWDGMREVNGFFLFELGRVAMLGWLQPGVDFSPVLDTLRSVKGDLETFANTKGNQDDLPRSVDDARDLIGILDAIIKQPNPVLTKGTFQKLAYRLFTFRDRLGGDLGHVYSYVLEEKGGRSVKTLWKSASAVLISPAVLASLSDFTVENIDEAAKCWVVDRPTAVGFHMMRAVEGVLREYKQLVTGQGVSWTDKRGEVRYQGFGTLVGDLEKKLEELKKNKTSFGKLDLGIGILRPLGKLYRDPLAHPEIQHLREDDAKLAFESGISAINTMVQDVLDGGPHFAIAYSSGTKL